MCVKYSGRPDALLQGEEEKECQRRSVRSETDIKFNCHFQQYEQVFVGLLRVFVCLLPQIFGPYHKIQTNNKRETSALTAFKKSCATWLADGSKTKKEFFL